jgi:hypothetical protein
MLDDDDGVAFIDETVEDVDQAADVLVVQADGGFFDQIEIGDLGLEIADLCFRTAAFDEFGNEFDALGLAT